MYGGNIMAEPQTFLNELLAHLPHREWELLAPHATIVNLRHAEQIFDDHDPGTLTYFPLTSIVSMIAQMENGDECEYGCIGREGMLGLHVALGAQPLRGQGLCQLEGAAVRLDGKILQKLTDSGEAPELHRLLLRYAQASINVLAQSAACNALHAVVARTARWLLQSHDRAGKDEFSLTQDFLARMLGVRRASVTEVALEFAKDGSISYTRGHIKVLDRDALLAKSCECYRLMRDEYELVFVGGLKHTNGQVKS
jgi:CRP-like cAMP-binding protein